MEKQIELPLFETGIAQAMSPEEQDEIRSALTSAMSAYLHSRRKRKGGRDELPKDQG